MTPTQARYLSYIFTYTVGFGVPPAESEIASALKVAPPSVHRMLKSLESKGFIRRQPGVARSIEILVSADAIPRWEGQRITRTIKTWNFVGPGAISVLRTRNAQSAVYRFKITLRDTTPPVWRRLETLDVTLEALHELIQTAMGWTNSHLHQFEIAGVFYANPRTTLGGIRDDELIDYHGISISDMMSKHGPPLRMCYEYDLGDGWQHDVELEAVTERALGAKYPRCIDGERACPPEDVGGALGFAEYVEAVADPSHPRHDEFVEWNGPFDPAFFDASAATRRMQRELRP